MKNQEPNSNNEFKSEEIDKRYEMDSPNYIDYGASHANADGSYTYVATDGHTYDSEVSLNRNEANEHAYDW